MSLEWKSLEGQRIQSVMGAIGALPAAALVFGDDAAASAPGAPLYVAAIIFMIGAYTQWLYTDGIYHLGSQGFVFEPEVYARYEIWERDRLHSVGYRFQAMVYLYAMASLFCTIAGLAGVYSKLRLGVSVEAGFLVAVGIAVAVFSEIVVSGTQRNRLIVETREWSRLRVQPD